MLNSLCMSQQRSLNHICTVVAVNDNGFTKTFGSFRGTRDIGISNDRHIRRTKSLVCATSVFATAGIASPFFAPNVEYLASLSIMPSTRSKSPSAYRKSCDLCKKPRDVLVRCRIDDTLQWHFICTGTCWKRVSGGVVDGTEDKPNYVYGGMWKNKHAGVSAAKKPKTKNPVINDWSETQPDYIQNDKVKHEGKVWTCRRSHNTNDKSAPTLSYRFWKEATSVTSGDEKSEENPPADT